MMLSSITFLFIVLCGSVWLVNGSELNTINTDERFARLENMLLVQREEINILKFQMKERYDDVQTLTSRMKKRDDDIQALTSGMKNRDNEIQVLTTGMNNRDDEIRTLRVEMLERDREIQTLRAEMVEKTSEQQPEIERRSGKTQTQNTQISKEGHVRMYRQYEETEVAFFAKLGVNAAHLGQNQAIVFDQVVTNVDSTNSIPAYSNVSGTFTAPVAGLYVFSVTMHSLTHDSTHYRIFKNNDQISTLYVHGGEVSTTDSTSQTVILALIKGDAVSVHHSDVNHGAFGYGHSLFSGFLLYLHETVQVIG